MPVDAKEKEAMYVTATKAAMVLKEAKWESGMCIIQHRGSIAMSIHSQPGERVAEGLVDALHAGHTAILDMMKKIGIEPIDGNHMKNMNIEMQYINGVRVPLKVDDGKN
jgi:hypothetical protein